MILAAIFGFLGGIAAGSFLHIDIWFILALGVLSLAFFIYGYFVEEERRRVLLLCGVVLLAFVFGLARVSYSPLYQNSELAQFENKKVTVEGMVAGDPDVREKNTILTVDLSGVTENGKTTPVHEKVLITTSIYPDFRYGDIVHSNVTLKKPKQIESDDGRVFDYEGYLRVRDIWYTASFTTVSLVSSGHGNFVVAKLLSIKHAFTRAIGEAIPAPESDLLGGLLLGAKQSLGKEILTEFQRTGTSHVVVLSGYNITIVAESIMALLVFLPQLFAFIAGGVSVVLFTILAGGGASAWRAAIMVLVALFGKKLGREYEASRAFGFAVVVMLAPNPLLLVFDPSFQLSVLATIGIIFVSPLVEPYFTKVTERFGIREVASATIATQIVVLPFLLYSNGILSLVSLPVNVLILGTIPITMLFGFLTGALGLLSLWLSFIPALPTYLLLWYQLAVVRIGSSLSWGILQLPAFSFGMLAVIYAVICVFLYIRRRVTARS
jgi:competence protein ComEC